MIVKLWSDALAEFVPFLAFDVEIRKVACSMNAIVRPSVFLPRYFSQPTVSGSGL
ncbi:hypothetical protein [Streptomyces sp. NPDC047990]|uniref:hypothetical protein n=1 Tax=Streptomyces sp. NPDC047990 TaxID=3365496 RepID=UPI00371CA184